MSFLYVFQTMYYCYIYYEIQNEIIKKTHFKKVMRMFIKLLES